LKLLAAIIVPVEVYLPFEYQIRASNSHCYTRNHCCLPALGNWTIFWIIVGVVGGLVVLAIIITLILQTCALCRKQRR